MSGLSIGTPDQAGVQTPGKKCSMLLVVEQRNFTASTFEIRNARQVWGSRFLDAPRVTDDTDRIFTNLAARAQMAVQL